MEVIILLMVVGIFVFYMTYMCLAGVLIGLGIVLMFLSEMWEGFLSLFRKKEPGQSTDST